MKLSDENKRGLEEKLNSSKAELCLLKGKVSVFTEIRDGIPSDIHAKRDDFSSSILTEIKK